jgi:hypothetical protein
VPLQPICISQPATGGLDCNVTCTRPLGNLGKGITAPGFPPEGLNTSGTRHQMQCIHSQSRSNEITFFSATCLQCWLGGVSQDTTKPKTLGCPLRDIGVRQGPPSVPGCEGHITYHFQKSCFDPFLTLALHGNWHLSMPFSGLTVLRPGFNTLPQSPNASTVTPNTPQSLLKSVVFNPFLTCFWSPSRSLFMQCWIRV